MNVLTLTEQLDAMLLGWLERRAGNPHVDAVATTIVTVAAAMVEEVEAFCARWGLKVERLGGSALKVSGPQLPVLGFAEITAMYRA